MEYEAYIVDECGTPRYKLSDLSSEDERDILEAHPEWSVRAL